MTSTITLFLFLFSQIFISLVAYIRQAQPASDATLKRWATSWLMYPVNFSNGKRKLKYTILRFHL